MTKLKYIKEVLVNAKSIHLASNIEILLIQIDINTRKNTSQ